MRDMRDSGVEWIGAIPSDWELIRFKDKWNNKKEIAGTNADEYERLALTLNGVVKRPKDDSEGLQPQAFDGYQILRENDFVFKMIDLQNISTSRVGLSPYTGLVSPAYIRFAPRDENQHSKFTYYFLMSMYYNCVYNNLGGDGVRSALNASDMGRFNLPWPDEDTQEKISEHLDAEIIKVDNLIANVQAQIEKLKAYKQSIITEVMSKGLDPTATMKDSEIDWLGKIPETWDVVKVLRIADKTHPYAIGDGDHGLIKPDDYQQEGIPYIRVQNLGWATDLDTSNIVYISEETNNKIKGSTLRPNDVLFAKTGATIGKTAIIPQDMPIANTTSHVGKITVSPKYDPRYIFYVLSSTIGYRQFWEYASTKTTRPELAIDEIKQVYITLPRSKEEQSEIVAYLDKKCNAADKLIAIKEKKVELLQQYKKSLIYEYVTGKKEVV